MPDRYRCDFCADGATYAYESVPLCRWHLILLYLALALEFTD